MARRRRGVPPVIAYWWKPPSMARGGASCGPGGAPRGARRAAAQPERPPAVVGLDVRPADVDDDVEVLHEPVDDRLLDEGRGEREPHAHPGHPGHRLSRPR